MPATNEHVGELDSRLTRLERIRRGGGGTVGPAGPAGPQGATGPAGPQGVAGPEGLNWRGPWDGAAAYAQDDAVSYAGSSWIAPAAMTVGTVPGAVPSDPLVYTVRGVRTYASDRLNSATFVAKTISAASDVTDISGRKAESVLIDRTASTAHNLTVRNDHPSALMNAAVYDGAGNFQTIFANGIAANGGTAVLALPAGSNDLIAIAYFTSVDAGSFAVSVSNPATLVAPPLISPQWQLLAQKGDVGAQGPAGAGGAMEVYEQPGAPATTNVGAIWVDTAAPVPVVQRPLTYADLLG
jgi:hypothetical protein